jgi:hypothetical protein
MIWDVFWWTVVECGIADLENTGSIPFGCLFASLRFLMFWNTYNYQTFFFACMIWRRQCSRVWHAHRHRCCSADTNAEISDVYDLRVSAQDPPPSTGSFTKTISSYPYPLAIIYNLAYPKFTLTS